MYTISKGRICKDGYSRSFHLGTTDSFASAVYLAQLAGGGCVESAHSKTHVGKTWACKPAKSEIRLKPVTSNLMMMLAAYLLSR